jgi:hypothetical protein
MPEMKGKQAPAGEQMSVFEDLVAVPVGPIHEPAPDTMRHIVSLRMPDALLERVEEVALIAAGLDRSYAAITPDELASELAALRKGIDEIATRLRAGE